MEYINDTFNEYLGKKDYVSASDIKNFLISPRYYYWERYEKQEEKGEKERHFIIGSAIHEIILEPHLFDKHFIICPQVDRRTKIGKETYNKIINDNPDKLVLFDSEIDIINGIGENALKNEYLQELIRDTYRELSVYTQDEKTGLKLRMRPDSLHKTDSKIIDLKSTISSAPRDFRTDVFKYGYSITAAYYLDFIGREDYIFACFEKTPPFQISLYVLDDEKIEWGRQQYRMALDLMSYCFENNYYPDYMEFEMLKEAYLLDNYRNFIEEKNKIQPIII